MNKKRIKNKIIKNIWIVLYILFTSLICSIINIPYIPSLIIISLSIHIPVVINKTIKEKNKDLKKIDIKKDIKKYQKEITPVYKRNITKEKVKTRIRKK